MSGVYTSVFRALQVASDPDYEPDLCSKIVTVWGGDYCLNNMFAMICPVACTADCLVDNEEAAEQYSCGWLFTGLLKVAFWA